MQRDLSMSQCIPLHYWKGRGGGGGGEGGVGSLQGGHIQKIWRGGS